MSSEEGMDINVSLSVEQIRNWDDLSKSHQRASDQAIAQSGCPDLVDDLDCSYLVNPDEYEKPPQFLPPSSVPFKRQSSSKPRSDGRIQYLLGGRDGFGRDTVETVGMKILRDLEGYNFLRIIGTERTSQGLLVDLIRKSPVPSSIHSDSTSPSRKPESEDFVKLDVVPKKQISTKEAEALEARTLIKNLLLNVPGSIRVLGIDNRPLVINWVRIIKTPEEDLCKVAMQYGVDKFMKLPFEKKIYLTMRLLYPSARTLLNISPSVGDGLF
ncbi:MAG: putative phosphoprotein [Wufeng shrew rhabdovirus 1]|nr:MAG: putative phosphoprotein [Wufeng shrew rhabdovirus 1]